MNNTINGRAPDEIKKGLECCSKLKTNCSLCPYAPTVDGDCMNGLVPDALAYIQRLERERDAAVEQLKEVDRLELFCCSHCKHEELDDFSCTTCIHMSNWEWIGAQEVE